LIDPLFLGRFVAVATILVLFSGVSIILGLLIVSAGFLIVFDGMRSLALMPESRFGKLNNFALLSILIFIIMGSSIASTRAGADLYEALERWLTRMPGALLYLIWGPVRCLRRYPGPALQPVLREEKWASPRCANAAIPMGLRQGQLPQVARWAF